MEELATPTAAFGEVASPEHRDTRLEPRPRDSSSRIVLLTSSPQCGARRKRDGQPCQGSAMRSKINGRYTRCKFHGGASTGPRTPEGRARWLAAITKHGKRSAQAKAERAANHREFRELMAQLDALEKEFEGLEKLNLSWLH